MLWITIVFILILLFISIYDFYHTRIPNFFSVSILFLGFTYNYLLFDSTGIITALYGLLTGLSTSLFFYRFASLGAGDVKLISAIGCLVGYQLILIIIAYSYVVSAILGIVYIKLWGRWYQNKKLNTSKLKSKKMLSQRIPMAPGISIATFYVMYNYPI